MSALSGALAYGGDAQGAVDAGGYVISASGLSSNNYAIRYVNGALTIDPALLQVIGATALNKSYDGTNSASVINASLAGVIAGDNVALSPANATFASVNVGQGLAVVTDYTLSGTAARNYVLDQPAGLSADIVPRELTISALPESREFSAPNPELLYAISGQGLVAGNSLSGALTTSATTASNPGAYAIGLGSLSAGSNYVIDYVGASLTVLSSGNVALSNPSLYADNVTPPASAGPIVSISISPDAVPFKGGAQGGGGIGPGLPASSFAGATDFTSSDAAANSNSPFLADCGRKLLASPLSEYRAASVDGLARGACVGGN